MSDTRFANQPANVDSTIELAQLLERMEANPRFINADQYRSIVARLQSALTVMPDGQALQAVLATFPATAQLYENLNYEHAGLVRSPLETAVNAELTARQALAQAAKV